VARLDCRDLAQLLSAECERLFLQFVPDARIESGELRGHGPDGAKWTMAVRGGKRGIFCNWGSPEQYRGDCIELIHAAKFPHETGRKESYQFALAWLGLEGNDDANAERMRQARTAASERRAWRSEEDAATRAKRRSQAIATYLGGSPPVPDGSSEIADYLTTRGIPWDWLPWKSRGLRFSRDTYYDTEHPHVPAMVAPMVHPLTHTQTGTHVTYLEHRDGHWRNTRLALRRRTLGDKKGSIIPLMRGASGKALAAAPEGDTVLIAEGIENAYAAALCCPDIDHFPDNPRVWAAIDVGNFAAIEIPEPISSVILVADGDRDRFGDFREAIAYRWLEAGKSVHHMRPPKGYKDFNAYVAWLVAERAGQGRV
jgi:hypothetical protein